MSGYVVSIISGKKLGSPTRKSIMLVIADCANDDGTGIWKSHGNIAASSEISKRTVQRQISDMVEEGLLNHVGWHVYSSGNKTKQYDINLEKIHQLCDVIDTDKFIPVKNDGGDRLSWGDTDDIKSGVETQKNGSECHPNSQEPLRTVHKNTKKDLDYEFFHNTWTSHLFKTAVPPMCRKNKKGVYDAIVKKIKNELKSKTNPTEYTVRKVLNACYVYYTKKDIKHQIRENKQKGLPDGKFIKQLISLINGDHFVDYIDEPIIDFAKFNEKDKVTRNMQLIDTYFSEKSKTDWPKFLLGEQPSVDDNGNLVKPNSSKLTKKELEYYFKYRGEV